MNDFGELSATGVVLSNAEMKERRFRRGECVICGTKCFKKTIFKTVPLTEDGKVLRGRCLQCNPLDKDEMRKEGSILTAQVEFASEKDLRRATSTRNGFARGTQSWNARRKSSVESTSDTTSEMIRRSASANHVTTATSQEHLIWRSSRGTSQVDSRNATFSLLSPSRLSTNSGVGTSDTTSEMIRRSASANHVTTATSQEHLIWRSSRSTSQVDSRNATFSLLSPSRLSTNSGVGAQNVQEIGAMESRSSTLTMATNGQLSCNLNPRRSSINRRRFSIDKEIDLHQHLGTQSSMDFPSDDSSQCSSQKFLRAGKSSDWSLGTDNVSTNGRIISKPNSTLSTLIQTVADHGDNSEAKPHAVKTLCDLICDTNITRDNISAIVDERGIQLLLDAMDANQGNQVMTTSICSAIYALSTDKRIQVAIANECGIFTIIKVIDEVSDNQDIAALFVLIIGELCENGNNAENLVRAEGHRKIVDIMSRFGESANIQEICIKAIMKMAHDELLHQKFLEANGAHQISIIMIMFSSNVRLLELAMNGLRSLGSGSSSKKEAVANTGAIDSIVSAMQIHRNDPAIQSASARTLGDLSMSIAAAKQIGECGGIDLLTRGVYVHIDDLKVTKRICRAMEFLSKCTDNHALMVDIGVIKAVICVMQHQSNEAPVISSCLAILSNLAKGSPEIAISIVEDEALDSISMSMVMHSEERSLQKNACSVLATLMCETTLDSLLAIGVNDLMAAAVQKFPSECKHNVDKVLAAIRQLI
eukprot:scaffold10203_cov272-Chaetoceros_neogracile.AAC.22